jgi:CheY-like chemotaxis protein
MKRILVAEDDPYNRDLVTTILHFYGFATLPATNGRHAVKMAQESLPDLIMMDLSMPIQNGLDATREIKEMSELAHIPIVAMSAYDTREDKRHAFEAGCVDFLPKPLELFKLKDRLDNILAAY